MSAPQVNGPTSPTGKYIDNIDPDDPEYQRQMRRPAEIKEDVRQMQDRSRVSLILNSEAFRKEIEDIIKEQFSDGNCPDNLIALQQITELLNPTTTKPQSGYGGAPWRGIPSVIPITDIKGTELTKYSKQEKYLRSKLASCYRVIDLNGWSQGIYNHISARINQEQEHFLLNPFGLLYSEVTASSLVKVDMQGEVIDAGSTTLGINKAGFVLHSAIHQGRPDIKCIIHLHTPEAVAVSTMKCGFLPLSQEALTIGDVSYHDYGGILVDETERDLLQRNLGPSNKVMFLRNHGFVACGATVEEAYYYANNVMEACMTQTRAVPAGIDNLILVSEEIKKTTFAVATQGGGGVDTGGRKWKTGEMEYEAIMRQLDNIGYRTGYLYRNPQIKQEVRKEKTNSDVEIPPTSSSFTYIWDGDIEHSKYVSPLKLAKDRQRQNYKAGWLVNSPNAYTRQEIEETGTPNPKKYSKWIPEADGSPNRKCTPIRLENPNQFAPQGDNPKEYKLKQKAIRKDYYEERISAGPTSKILEGITWEEAKQLQDGDLSMVGDNVIVYGAASKGIIQRDQQHNMQVYKTQYAANPFDSINEEEIEKYRIEVEQKGKGDTTGPTEDLSPGPDGKLISTEERMQIIHQQQVETTPEHRPDVEKPKPQVPVETQRQPSNTSHSEETTIDDVFQSNYPQESPVQSPVEHRVKSRHKRASKETNIDDLFDDKYIGSTSRETLIDDVYLESQKYIEKPVAVRRSSSNRDPPRSPEYRVLNGDEKPSSPAKSDTLKSTDSASGGDTLEDRSSKEGSPVKELPSPTKDKKKKKKFRMPSFSKTKKNKESKESTL